jgi:hypothetical protein
MKNILFLLGTGVVTLMTGCASTRVALAPVGPDPVGANSLGVQGGLQVFSGLVGRSEGNNPNWYQHTDYYVYDLHGKLVKHVNNTIGYYASAPRQVTLPVGRYLVKARANDYFWVSVPVIIESGQTTRVHLDDNWKLPANARRTELVSLPNGNPVGWQAEPTKETRFN